MRLSQLAKDQVSLEAVVIGNLEELLEGSLDRGDGTHVLKVGAEALELEGGPDEDLGHAAGVVGELGEHVGGGLVGFLGALDGLSAVPEQDLLHC